MTDSLDYVSQKDCYGLKQRASSNVVDVGNKKERFREKSYVYARNEGEGKLDQGRFIHFACQGAK